MSSPRVHSVHFYAHDEALVARLHNIVEADLKSGNSVLIVATEEHRAHLAAALQESGPEVQKCMDCLEMFDARETLAKFMIDGHPSDKRFSQSVGNLIADARKKAKNAHRGLTVFGEMVALLWQDGNKVAALELERMWNDALQERSFHLHCAYPRWIVEQNQDLSMVNAICNEHSSVLGHAPRLRPSAGLA
ncbi:MAG: MEDS domain-containing protein [Acidobacteria bacterium]|nr:MEDS domain-containing protein [Acidobacteriota bacterium]